MKSLQDNSNECRGHSVWMGKGSWSRRRHMKEARSSTKAGRRVVQQVRQIMMHDLSSIPLQQGLYHDYA